MKKISERVAPDSWTCQVRGDSGRLPDLTALRSAVHGVGAPFSLRGIEAVAEGQLARRGGALWLRLSPEEEVQLAPLTKKVQWDPRTRRPQEPTPAERRAYARLLQAPQGPARRVRVVGPLHDDPRLLEVRRFTLRP